MTDAELNDLLRAARVPERPAEYWQRFPARVVACLPPRAVRTVEAIAVTRPTLPLWKLGWAVTLVGVLVALVFFKYREPPPEHHLAQTRKIYAEAVRLFPQQIRAIVIDEAGVRLELAERADLPFAPPVLLRLCKGQRCRSVLTFSGQQVRLDGEGFEVLEDSQQQVWLAGRHAVWSSAEPDRLVSGFRIEARVLESAL